MGLISLLGKSKPNHSFKQTITDIIGYPPKNLVLFERVFTHRSLEKVGEDGRKINYERLEFLGDAVLGTIIGNYLFSQMPDSDEGDLTQMRSKIVRREFLNHIGKSLGLYPLLRSKVDKDRYGDDIHGNIFEALVGAVFVDVGFSKCQSFVKTKVIEPYVDLATFEDRVISYKGVLVNWFQQQKMIYRFDVFEDSGANKSLVFKAKLFVNNDLVASARASNKKKAAEKVSKRAYFKFADRIRQQKQIKRFALFDGIAVIPVHKRNGLQLFPIHLQRKAPDFARGGLHLSILPLSKLRPTEQWEARSSFCAVDPIFQRLRHPACRHSRDDHDHLWQHRQNQTLS